MLPDPTVPAFFSDWCEKIESVEKKPTPKERYAAALRLKRDLQKLPHEHAGIVLNNPSNWPWYEKLKTILEAEIPALKAEAEIENWQLEDQQPSDRVLPAKTETVSQEAWLHQDKLEDFKNIIRQLSIVPNLFVDKKTYKNAELIFKGHFTNPRLPIDPKHMINWIGIGYAYRVFFDLLVKTERIEEQPYSHFFKAHFLRKGDPFQNIGRINGWCEDKRKKNRDQPHEDEKKLKKIVF